MNETSKRSANGGGSVTAVNPSRASAFAIPQDHMQELLTEGGGTSSAVECRRPPKGHFFTVQSETGGVWENRGFYFLLEIEGRDAYLVDPRLAKEKLDRQEDDDVIRPVLLVRFVTMAGVEGLWPVKLDRGEKTNAWNVSARNILRIAEGQAWVRIVSSKGQYQHQQSRKSWSDVPPRFTGRAFSELVDAAFADRFVEREHKVWDELRDGSTK
jgi:hypothetical protein